MIVPVLAGAVLLGIAFDMRQGTSTSVDVFDKDDIKANIQIIPKMFTTSRYKVIHSSSDVNNMLNVDGDISLKVMNNQFTLDGAGDYFKGEINRDKTVELLITCDFESQTETFPSYVKEARKSDGTSWRDVSKDVVGTHYIRSITYGGQLIISYRLTAIHSEYMEDILATVNANLALSSGSLSGDIKGNFEKLEKDVQDKATVTIKAISTTGQQMGVITSIEQVFDLVDKYPGMVKETTGGKGAALRIELVDLSTLRSDISAYLKNYALDSMLKEAMDKYDDIRAAMALFKTWKSGAQFWTDDELKMANEFYQRVFETKEEFDNAIFALDATKGTDQFDAAFKKYGFNGDNIPNRYSRDLDRLIHIIDKKPFMWFPYSKSVSHYIHWGGQTCSLPSTEPVYTGFAATSPKGYGSGGNFLCLSKDLPKQEDAIKANSGTVVSHITGLGYQTMKGATGQVNCAYCRLENATAVMTIPGRTDCPAETKLEYAGYLMTSSDAGSAQEFVCLDRKPDNESDAAKFSDETVGTLVPVWMACDGCDEDEKNRYLSCVVCSR